MPKQPVTLPKSPVTISRNSLSVTIAEMTGHDAEIGGHDQPKYAYYRELGRAQHGGLDVTPWMVWFARQVRIAWEAASAVVDTPLEKARFWTRHADAPLNARQRKAVNALLGEGPGGFEGGMSTRKYVSLTSTSRPTASRELIELHALGVLMQSGAGRSTRYYINLPGWFPQRQ